MRDLSRALLASAAFVKTARGGDLKSNTLGDSRPLFGLAPAVSISVALSCSAATSSASSKANEMLAALRNAVGVPALLIRVERRSTDPGLFFGVLFLGVLFFGGLFGPKEDSSDEDDPGPSSLFTGRRAQLSIRMEERRWLVSRLAYGTHHVPDEKVHTPELRAPSTQSQLRTALGEAEKAQRWAAVRSLCEFGISWVLRPRQRRWAAPGQHTPGLRFDGSTPEVIRTSYLEKLCFFAKLNPFGLRWDPTNHTHLQSCLPRMQYLPLSKKRLKIHRFVALQNRLN